MACFPVDHCLAVPPSGWTAASSSDVVRLVMLERGLWHGRGDDADKDSGRQRPTRGNTFNSAWVGYEIRGD